MACWKKLPHTANTCATEGSQRLLGDLALALGDAQAEGPPLRVEGPGVAIQRLPAADPQEARLDHRADPLGGRVEAELHERLGIPATQLHQGFVRHQQGPEQQPLDVGPIGIERRLVARVGLQKTPGRAVAFDGLTFLGKAQQELPHQRQLAAQLQEVELVKAGECFEQRLRGLRHSEAFLETMGMRSAGAV